MQEVHVVEWVNKLSKRLKEMMQVVCEKERLAKERMKKHYDKNAKLREFNEGALVLEHQTWQESLRTFGKVHMKLPEVSPLSLMS